MFFRIFDYELKPAQIFENAHSPVLTKTYIGIDKIICGNELAHSQYQYTISSSLLYNIIIWMTGSPDHFGSFCLI